MDLSHIKSNNTYADSDQELIEVDGAGFVGIEEVHEALHTVTEKLDKLGNVQINRTSIENTYLALGLGDVAANVLESSEEFVGIALSVTIHGVEVSEGSSETSDGLGASSGELGTHLVENYSNHIRLAQAKIVRFLASLLPLKNSSTAFH